jgi:hypothetical protein
LIDLNPVAVLASVAATVVLSVCAHRRLLKPWRAEVDRLKDLLCKPEILEAHYDRMAKEFEVSADGKTFGAKVFAASFKNAVGNAANFVEIQIGDDQFGHYIVTIQRRWGRSPADMLATAENHIRTLLTKCVSVTSWNADCAAASAFLDRPRTIEEKP